MTIPSLSRSEAVRLALRAQGLERRPAQPGGSARVRATLQRLGAVQLDTIAVLARSHELVQYARSGPIGRARVEQGYWDGGSTWEYWSHAACILPQATYPWFAFRRRDYVPKAERRGVTPAELQRVRAALAERGPVTTRELGGGRRQAGWWEWSAAKVTVEWLLAVGEVVVAKRDGWRRVYDLGARVLPAFDTTDWVDERGVFGPSDIDCLRWLVRESVRTLGVGTVGDIRDVHRLHGYGSPTGDPRRSALAHAIAEVHAAGEIVRVDVEGWSAPTYADPVALQRIPRSTRSVTTLLSPFDSLVWYRERLERMFGLRHRIEAYTPAAQRTHGYFSMPVLHEGAVIALVDPARDGQTLVARRVTAVAGRPDAEAVAIALADAATWVGATAVRVEHAPTPTWARTVQQRATQLLAH